MKRTQTALIVIAVTIVASLSAAAMAADVLDIGYGAKSIGLGKTYTSVNGDAYGIFGNPASLKGVTTGEVVSMYGQMSSDVSYTMLGYVLPTKYGKFFAGYANNETSGLTSTTLDATTGRPAAVSNFDFGNSLFMLGYENSLTKQISYGLRLKYLSEGAANIAGYSGSGMNADIGILAEINDKLTLGLTAKNVMPGQTGALNLSNGQTEDQTFGVDMGVGYKPHPKLGLYADVDLMKDIPAEGKLGIEWKPIDMLALRLGAEEKSAGNNSSYVNGSAGVGLQLGIFGIDYAYYYDSLIQSNSRHFISISIKTPGVSAPEPQYKEAATAKISTPIMETPKAEVAVSKPAEVAQASATNNTEYVVKNGDCLSKIAEKVLGHWRLCYKIAKDNNIKNPDLIFPGQRIRVER